MYAPEYDKGSALPGEPSDSVAPEGVAGVNTDSNDIARTDGGEVKRLYGFVAQDRITELGRSGSCKYEKPSRGYDSRSKRGVTRVNYMDSQATASTGAAA
jgi:hypothetical protein